MSSYHTLRAVTSSPKDLPVNVLFGDSIRGTGRQVFRVRSGPGQFRVLFLKPDGTTSEVKRTADGTILEIEFRQADCEISGLILKRLEHRRSTAVQHWPESLPTPATEHTPPPFAATGKPLIVKVRVSPSTGIEGTRLYYRPLNEMAPFRVIRAERASASFTIASEELSARWDEVLHNGNGGWFHPDPNTTSPYFVVRVQ